MASRPARVGVGMALVAALAAATLPAATPQIGLDEITPGMRGVGITVFDGAVREEFGVEVIGVLANVIGPRRSLILARLDGGPLAETGVIQGMSGSPVYFDGRLAGAVSYALGSFSTEAIAGITPIGEMAATDASPVPEARRRPAPILVADAPRADLAAALRSAFARTEPFSRRPDDIRGTGLPAADARRLATLLRPIATPLLMNGFVPDVVDLWTSALDAGGFVAMVGGVSAVEAAASQAGDDTAPLQAGDAVGASLMRGDLNMTGTGTVTLVDEGRVYAFGHPFYNLGRAQLPMTRAQVATLLPSLAISSKLTTVGDVLGTIDQDRSTGIYGSFGPGPNLIPVNVSIALAGGGPAQSFAFEIIDDPFFTPLLTMTGVLNTLVSWSRDVIPAGTWEVSGAAHLGDGHDPIRIRNVFAGPAAGINASLATSAPVTTVLANRFAPVGIERIDVAITAHNRSRTARLERVRVDAPRPRAGDSVPVTLTARTAEGEAIVETVTVALPRHVTGAVRILVADAAALEARDAAAGRQAAQARSLPQLIRALNRTRQQDRFYLQLLASRPGAVVGGEARPALPPSVLAVLGGDRAGGDIAPLGEATLGEWEVPTGHVVSGSRLITLAVEPAEAE